MLRNFDLDSELDDTNEVEKMSNKNRADKDSSKSREQQLMEENAREARKERDFQNLRADVLDEMINIAEHKFDIKIRKKSGVKR